MAIPLARPLLAAAIWACGNGHHRGQEVQCTDLVSDMAGAAASTDPNLVNAVPRPSSSSRGQRAPHLGNLALD